MLIRQKTILAILLQANKPLKPKVFVNLVFLLRQETDLKRESTFYDFVPYKYGPSSFVLNRELTNLRRDDYVTPDEERIAICEQNSGLAEEKINELPAAFHKAVDEIVKQYGKKNQTKLVNEVNARYQWYAIKSKPSKLQPKSSAHLKKARPAIYTIGYEGKSVDAFFNRLLKNGIRLVIDVRANPISRRYGFSKRRFREIAISLGMDYRHMPEFGIPGKFRVDLSDFASYQYLMKKYEQEMLPGLENEVDELGKLMMKKPAVLVCVEKDVHCCHRSRLANAVFRKTRLEVKHI